MTGKPESKHNFAWANEGEPCGSFVQREEAILMNRGSFMRTRPGMAPVAIKLPIFFRRWAAKLGFIKAYEAPHPISSLAGFEGNIFAACQNMVFKLDEDGVMRPLRFDVDDVEIERDKRRTHQAM